MRKLNPRKSRSGCTLKILGNEKVEGTIFEYKMAPFNEEVE
jgi:hypothetical protein